MAAVVAPIDAAISGTQSLRLRFDMRAEYRLSRIGRPVDLGEWKKQARKFAFLCDWLWALAVDCPFDEPADLAASISRDRIGALIEAMFSAIEAGMSETAEKKSTSSSGPSTASPSG